MRGFKWLDQKITTMSTKFQLPMRARALFHCDPQERALRLHAWAARIEEGDKDENHNLFDLLNTYLDHVVAEDPDIAAVLKSR